MSRHQADDQMEQDQEGLNAGQPRGEANGSTPGGAGGDGQSPTVEVLQQEIEGLSKTVTELNDKILRLTADYQNYVRRSQQSVGEARDQQAFEMAKSLVNVLDLFDTALQVDPSKASVQNLMQGMQMVRTELLKALERFGVKRIEAQPGEEFDPRRHEALMQQPADGVPQGHVAAPLQPGYVHGDRTVRAAKVAVAQ